MQKGLRTANFMQAESGDHSAASIPRILPILPLRNKVAYPFSVLPLVVGIARSVSTFPLFPCLTIETCQTKQL
jgi:hypothetical protein